MLSRYSGKATCDKGVGGCLLLSWRCEKILCCVIHVYCFCLSSSFSGCRSHGHLCKQPRCVCICIPNQKLTQYTQGCLFTQHPELPS